jgi:hypothetical protein
MKTSNLDQNSYKYKLVRKEGSLVKYGNELSYISWKKNGTFQGTSDYPSEGSSLSLDLEVGVKATHVSGQITKILSNSKEGVKFEAMDGTYELSYVSNQVVPEEKVAEVKPSEKLSKSK